MGGSSVALRLHTCIPFLIVLVLLASCQPPDHVKGKKGRTLTPDERYIVNLYMKITETEEYLQDNPEEREKKWDELRAEIDTTRVMAILTELERDPERWLPIYNRINELLKRRRE